MKRKLILLLLTAVAALCCAFAACSTDNKPSDNPDDKHEHKYEWIDNGDGTHKQHCSESGCDAPDINNENHVWGADNKCEKCKAANPNVEPPAHSHNWSQGWDGDDTHHWHNCTVDGCDVTDNSKKDGYGEHDFSNGDCTCGKPHEHVWAPDWTVGETTHYHACVWDECDGKNDETAHDFTNGDCNCGKPHEHVWATDWTVGETTHYHACIWDECDAKSDENAHDFTDGDCVCGAEKLSLSYELSADKTFFICTGLGDIKDTDIVIESSIKDQDGIVKPVTSIGDFAFNFCMTLTSIIIPDSVTTIGENAFNNCNGLTSVTIGNSVAYIGDYAFNFCSGLTSITLPDSVTTIGENAFGSCSGLTSIDFGNSVKTIGNSSFTNCSGLTSITIPNSVTSIGSDAFSSCPIENATIPTLAIWEIPKYNLKTVVITGGDSIFYNAFGGCGKLTSITILDTVTSIGELAFRGCSGLTSITIPDSVTSIGNYAFSGCSGFTSINIPDSVISIGENVFENCASLERINIKDMASWCAISGLNNLDFSKVYIDNQKLQEMTSITIPDTVTSIVGYAFDGCTALTSITIPDSVTSIGMRAFDNTAWYNNQPDGLVYAGKVAYKYKGTMPNNTTITLIDGTKGIASYAFSGCNNLSGITIPDSVISIGELVFNNCSLTRVYYTGDIASWCEISGIGGLMENPGTPTKTLYIDGKEITGELIIPDTVTSIGDYAFYGCNGLTGITIPDSVTSIGDGAFNGCYRLTSITIPDSVTSIGNGAFWNCSGLISITISDSVTSIGARAFCSCRELTSVTIPDSVTTIGDYAFGYCRGLTSITIPDSVISIGNNAFNGCSGLTSVSIGNSVTSIGDYAFSECSGLTSVTIGNSVTTIGSYAFSGCIGLTSITIPDSVVSIGNNAFNGCSGLTNVIIGNSVTTVDSYAFVDCSELTSINYTGDIAGWCAIRGLGNLMGYGMANKTLYIDGKEITGELIIPDSVTSIGSGAFRGCDRLTSVTIPDLVTTIGESAFSGCSGLTSVTIPDSVMFIENSTFSDCSALTSITFEGTKAEWKMVYKGSNWNDNTGDYTVHCTDGDLDKNGNEI